METERVKLSRKRIVDLRTGDTFRMSDGQPWETVKGWSESAHGIVYLYTTANTRGWGAAPSDFVTVMVSDPPGGTEDDGRG